jgi:hypothetical protein
LRAKREPAPFDRAAARENYRALLAPLGGPALV